MILINHSPTRHSLQSIDTSTLVWSSSRTHLLLCFGSSPPKLIFTKPNSSSVSFLPLSRNISNSSQLYGLYRLRLLMYHAVQEWEAVVRINRFIVVKDCTSSFYAAIRLNWHTVYMLKQLRSLKSKYSLSQEIPCLLSKPFRCALSTVISRFFKINLGLPLAILPQGFSTRFLGSSYLFPCVQHVYLHVYIVSLLRSPYQYTSYTE